MDAIAKKILDTLENNGFSSYIVGGYVRDFLIGKSTKDIDICTTATTREMLKMFSGTANSYGSFHIKVNEWNIDITTFRKEYQYKMRKPTFVVYTNDLKTDLLRRDFTINTICMDKQGNIIDLLDGKKDLQNKIIRIVGNTHSKIVEDPLRILRAIRFATILDFTIEKNLQVEIQNNKNLLKILSGYRIKEEISTILFSSNFKKGLQLLHQFSLCEIMGLSFSDYVYTNDLCGMWAQIKMNRNIPFTKIEKENIVKIQDILKRKQITRDILYEYGLYVSLIAGEILGIDVNNIHKMYQELPIYTRKDLRLSFKEICEILEVKPSRKVKNMEFFLIKEVINERVFNDKRLLKEYLLTNKSRWF